MSTGNYSTFEASDADSEGPYYCARHPDVETYLRCGKCGKPICAKCRVSTPVGFRCYDCANLQVLPTYALSADYYAKSIGAGLVAAAVVGVVMGVLPGFEFWAALLMGIVVPEAITAVANQKRGPGLQMIAMAAVVFGFVVSRVVLHFVPIAWDLDVNLRFFFSFLPRSGNLVLPVLGADPFFVNQYTIIWLALALFLANRRLA